MDIEERLAQLRSSLDEISGIQDADWKASLSTRKLDELSFHDTHRDRQQSLTQETSDVYEQFYGNKKYYGATQASTKYVRNWVDKEAPGKVFLDYACGNGGVAINAAKAGAALSIGIDISPVSIENAKADAASASLSNNTYFVQADAENTKLPDNSVDVVICSGMLHHLDLSYAFPELRRIMKPGAKLLAVEALGYNPAIRLYRLLTPAMRTQWEMNHILSHKDLKFAKHFFEIGEIHYWHISSILSTHAKSLSRVFGLLDQVLVKIPLVRLLAWIFTFELIAKE